MINLQVDEAYAFDYLSIMEVKKNLAPSPLRAEGYEKCRLRLFVLRFIKGVIGLCRI